MNATRTFVIAEAGVNHNGSLGLALELASAAKECGADAVKFQSFSADKLVTRTASKAAYQKAALPDDDSQYHMLKSLELAFSDFACIRDHCLRIGIEFLCSPFDEEAVMMLDQLDIRILKIPSGEITNAPFLRRVGSRKRPVILSTGMSWLGEVEAAVTTLRDAGAGDITLLHCVTQYPAPPEQINLRAMATLSAAFGLPVGYSDHTAGIEMSIAAVALGACVIEKHFTLDCSMSGPDHKASLEPTDFKRMTGWIRNIEEALGDGIKRPADCEVANIPVARRSIVAARDLEAGTTLVGSDLAIKRPGTGIPPGQFDLLPGRRTRRPVQHDDPINWQDLL